MRSQTEKWFGTIIFVYAISSHAAIHLHMVIFTRFYSGVDYPVQYSEQGMNDTSPTQDQSESRTAAHQGMISSPGFSCWSSAAFPFLPAQLLSAPMEHLCQLAAKEAKKGKESLRESSEKKRFLKMGSSMKNGLCEQFNHLSLFHWHCMNYKFQIIME